jgi:hypothetical protein
MSLRWYLQRRDGTKSGSECCGVNLAFAWFWGFGGKWDPMSQNRDMGHLAFAVFFLPQAVKS